jgi:hypothetical protein
MPLNFPIDPFGAPPPAPSPYGQMPDMSGLQAMMSSFGDTAQGLIDRNMGNPTQPGMSNDYLKALISGGTGDQNARFEAMYAPRRFQGEVAAELPNDPVFGGAFPRQGQPTVTQFAAPQQPAVGPITDDTISQMLNLGQIDGRASGVSLSPQQTSAALQNRLDDRADREAFNQRKFSVSPFAGADPTKVLGMMYEAALAEKEMQARMQEMAQKERMARWLGEQELGLKRDELGLRERGIDADIAQAAAEQQRLASGDAFSRQQFALTHGLDQQRLASEGQLTQKDLLGLILGEAGQSMGGPSEIIPLLRQLGVDLPAGMGAPATDAALPSATPLRSLPATLKEQIGSLPPEEQAKALRLAGKTEEEVTTILRAMNPNGIGVSAQNPDGSSYLWQTLKMYPFALPWSASGAMGSFENAMGGDSDQAWKDYWAR